MTLQNIAHQIEEKEMRDIRLSCPQCGAHLLADEADAGGQADCPQCAASVVIPGGPPTPPKPAEKQLFLYKDGQQMGPYPMSRITQMLSQNQIAPTDWAWTEGMTTWESLSTITGIALPPSLPPRPPSPPKAMLNHELANLFQKADGPESSGIDSLKVSNTWKQIFNLIEEAGGYVWSRRLYHLKYPKALTWKERIKVGFSLWGALFGPFYYLVKRMWAKALIYTAINIALLTFLELLTGYEWRYGGSVLFGMLAKWDYYLLKVKKKQLW